MAIRRRSAVLGLAALLAVTCLPDAAIADVQGTSSPGSEDVDFKTIFSLVDQRFSNAQDEPDRIAALLADDVVYQPPDEPEVVGKEAVAAWVQRDRQVHEQEACATILGFVGHSDWAYKRYERWSPIVGKSVYSKGIMIYRKGADGVWRIAVHTWNTTLPAPTVPGSCIPIPLQGSAKFREPKDG